MPYSNYAIIKAKIRDKKIHLKKLFTELDDSSGIYIIWRETENGDTAVYIGQAKHILERLAKHLLGYQAIDKSIKAHKLYDASSNVHGYKMAIREKCLIDQLDEREKYWINYYYELGYEMKNITGGGQRSKAEDINQRKAPKGYRDGLAQGYKNAIKEIKVFFDKYLDVVYKKDCFKSSQHGGEVKAIYKKKREEFEKLLQKGTNEND